MNRTNAEVDYARIIELADRNEKMTVTRVAAFIGTSTNTARKRLAHLVWKKKLRRFFGEHPGFGKGSKPDTWVKRKAKR